MDDLPRTLNDLFARAVEQYDTRPAVSYKQEGQWVSLSYRGLASRVRDLALGLYELGVRKGDRVALLCEHRIEWTMADLAILALGAVVVPIHASQSAEQVAYLLKDSDCQFVFVSTRTQLEKVVSLDENLKRLKHIFVIDRAMFPHVSQPISHISEVEQYGRYMAATQAGLFRELCAGVAQNELATIVYTSGTIGSPKGVMLTHSNLMANLHDLLSRVGLGESDVALSYLPLVQISQRLILYAYLYSGVTVYYMKDEPPPADLSLVRPTIMTGRPHLFEKIYQKMIKTESVGSSVKIRILHWALGIAKRWGLSKSRKDRMGLLLAVRHKVAYRLVLSRWRDLFGGRLRFCLIEGAVLSPELAFTFLGCGINIIQAYGMTEAPLIALGVEEENRVGTVGRPLADVQVKVAEDGEILVCGPNVTCGYLNLPQETYEAFSDGWLRTGDVGNLTKDGYLILLGRKRDLIKTSGGEYISPQRIESRIRASRFVSQVIVLGKNRTFPVALIVPNFELLREYARSQDIVFISNAELIKDPRIVDVLQRDIDRLTSDLAQYKKVRKIALLQHAFTVKANELTPMMKVKRGVIEKKYKDIIETLYAQDSPETAPVARAFTSSSK